MHNQAKVQMLCLVHCSVTIAPLVVWMWAACSDLFWVVLVARAAVHKRAAWAACWARSWVVQAAQVVWAACWVRCWAAAQVAVKHKLLAQR